MRLPATAPRGLEELLAGAVPCLFLSPHLDDAILSCGAFIRALARRCPVTVVTIFTAAGPRPHTFAARSFLRQCAAGDAGGLFAARRAEDREVLAGLGVGHVHLGRRDALFRRREVRTQIAQRFGRLLPELVHRYPTYRFDAARGHVARGDRRLMPSLTAEISDVVLATGARLVFSPIAAGRHVDHVIVRTIGERYHDRVVYYADFPYNQYFAPDPAFIRRHGLLPWSWEEGIAEKARLIRGYRTQAGALFPDGRIPVVAETFYSAAGWPPGTSETTQART